MDIILYVERETYRRQVEGGGKGNRRENIVVWEFTLTALLVRKVSDKEFISLWAFENSMYGILSE